APDRHIAGRRRRAAVCILPRSVVDGISVRERRVVRRRRNSVVAQPALHSGPDAFRHVCLERNRLGQYALGLVEGEPGGIEVRSKNLLDGARMERKTIAAIAGIWACAVVPKATHNLCRRDVAPPRLTLRAERAVVPQYDLVVPGP